MDVKTGKKIAKALVIVLIFILALGCFIHFVLGIGSWHGKSFEDFRARAYKGGSYSLTELPSGAQDFRFQCQRYGIAAYSYAAFTLNGEDYEDFLSMVSSLGKPSNLDGLEFTGKKVYEAMDSYDDYGTYIGFPKRRCDYVIDDDIKDYTVLYYDSYHGAGSHINAIVTNPDTGRVVIINGGSN